MTIPGEERALTLADTDGRFSLTVKPGIYETHFGRMGYREATTDTLDLRASSCELDVRLSPVNPAELEGF